jgi:hypothetical protein
LIVSRANEPAYPSLDIRDNQPLSTAFNHGLTIREHFAAMAMQGQLATNGPTSRDDGTDADPDECRVLIAQFAVEYADALLAELAKPVQTAQEIAELECGAQGHEYIGDSGEEARCRFCGAAP